MAKKNPWTQHINLDPRSKKILALLSEISGESQSKFLRYWTLTEGTRELVRRGVPASRIPKVE